MDQVWSQQFQGPRSSLPDLVDVLGRRGRLPNRGETLAIAFIRYETMPAEALALTARELKRLLARDAVALFQIDGCIAERWRAERQQLTEVMQCEGFEAQGEATYVSSAVAFSYVPTVLFRRAGLNAGVSS
jgi:hypothetical protein